MKRILLSSVALLGLTAFAAAADYPSRYEDATPYAAAPSFTWTGFYVGVNAGETLDDKNSRAITYGDSFYFGSFTDKTILGLNHAKDKGSFTGGGQIGANIQFESIVAGLEADFNYLDKKVTLRGTDTVSYGGDFALGEDLSVHRTIDWFGTVRGRIGVLPIDEFLVYGTAGLAYANLETNTRGIYSYNIGGKTSYDSPYTGSRSETRIGYTIGAGGEYAITQNLSLKGEYLYVDLGKGSLTSSYTGVGATADSGFTIRDRATFSVVRAGLNWKFTTSGY